MKRREFITLLGGAAAVWPLAVHAQAMPVIGYLSGLAASDRPNLVEMFRRGLGEAGFVDGRNITIEYRFADHQRERLRILANRSNRSSGRCHRGDRRELLSIGRQGVD